MADYLLFIDTETSGLPKNWDAPYSSGENWPYIAQLSWIVYTSDGTEVKRENHYISDDDFSISPSSEKIHGLTRAFLKEHGESRKKVLSLLAADLNTYQPLLVGHFLQFDFHMVGADAYRAGVQNPLTKFPGFCTMLATNHFVQNPAKKYLTLCELSRHLFSTPLQNHHNAFDDAQATALCFFELLKRGELNEKKIASQKKFLEEPRNKASNGGCIVILMSFVLLVTLIIIA